MRREPSSSVSIPSFTCACSETERAIDAAQGLKTGRIPLICGPRASSTLPDLVNAKFLVMPTMKVGTLTKQLQKRVATDSSAPFYLFIKDELLKASETCMEALYKAHRDPDNFLHIHYDNHIPNDAALMGSYRSAHSVEERFEEAKTALEQGKIPVICERREGSRLAPLPNKKFVVAPTMTVSAMVAALCRRAASTGGEQVYLFLGNSVLPASSISIKEFYNTYKDAEDGLLYVTYSDEIPPLTPQLGQYKTSFTHKERTQEAKKALSLEKVPIICERKEGSSIAAIHQRKFFVSQNITIGKLIEALKARIAQEVASPIYISVGGDILTNYNEPIMEVYDGYRDTDKFLYLTYSNARD